MSTLFGAGEEIHPKKGRKNKNAAHWTLPPNDPTSDPRQRRSTSRSPAPQNTFEIPNLEPHKSSKQMDYSSQNQDLNGENEVSIPMLEGTGSRFSNVSSSSQCVHSLIHMCGTESVKFLLGVFCMQAVKMFKLLSDNRTYFFLFF